jgi:hypothetical protein
MKVLESLTSNESVRKYFLLPSSSLFDIYAKQLNNSRRRPKGGTDWQARSILRLRGPGRKKRHVYPWVFGPGCANAGAGREKNAFKWAGGGSARKWGQPSVCWYYLPSRLWVGSRAPLPIHAQMHVAKGGAASPMQKLAS